MNDDDITEFEWTEISDNTDVNLSSYIGVRCPQCGMLSLKVSKNEEEYCTVCSYDTRKTIDKV